MVKYVDHSDFVSGQKVDKKGRRWIPIADHCWALVNDGKLLVEGALWKLSAEVDLPPKNQIKGLKNNRFEAGKYGEITIWPAGKEDIHDLLLQICYPKNFNGYSSLANDLASPSFTPLNADEFERRRKSKEFKALPENIFESDREKQLELFLNEESVFNLLSSYCDLRTTLPVKPTYAVFLQPGSDWVRNQYIDYKIAKLRAIAQKIKKAEIHNSICKRFNVEPVDVETLQAEFEQELG